MWDAWVAGETYWGSKEGRTRRGKAGRGASSSRCPTSLSMLVCLYAALALALPDPGEGTRQLSPLCAASPAPACRAQAGPCTPCCARTGQSTTSGTPSCTAGRCARGGVVCGCVCCVCGGGGLQVQFSKVDLSRLSLPFCLRPASSPCLFPGPALQQGVCSGAAAYARWPSPQMHL